MTSCGSSTALLSFIMVGSQCPRDDMLEKLTSSAKSRPLFAESITGCVDSSNPSLADTSSILLLLAPCDAPLLLRCKWSSSEWSWFRLGCRASSLCCVLIVTSKGQVVSACTDGLDCPSLSFRMEPEGLELVVWLS